MSPQENIEVTLGDMRNAHICHYIINEHFSGHPLHVCAIFHKQHVQVHVDIFELTSCKETCNLVDYIEMDSLVLHDTATHRVIAHHCHLSALPCIMQGKTDTDAARDA